MSTRYMVYHYDGDTGVFTRSGEDAQDNPRRPGTPLIPRNATTIAPMEAGANQAAVFKEGAWSLVPDYRDTVYYDKATRIEILLELGEAPTETMTDKEPKSNEVVWDDAAGDWTVPLDVAKGNKTAEIKGARRAAIENGTVTYEGVNINTSNGSKGDVRFAIDAVNDGGDLPPEWQGVDGAVPITDVSQLKGIASLIYVYTEEQFTKQFTLLKQVDGALTLAEVEAVTWI